MATVLILMGSQSDWPTKAAYVKDLGVSWEAKVVSAHVRLICSNRL